MLPIKYRHENRDKRLMPEGLSLFTQSPSPDWEKEKLPL
jgi:hypothetical protein